MWRHLFGGSHFKSLQIERAGIMRALSNKPDAANPAMAQWLTIEDQWRRVTDPERQRYLSRFSLMAVQQQAADGVSPVRNCVCMVIPVLAALAGPWLYVLPLLLVGMAFGAIMLTRPTRRVRQMGRSLLFGSGLSFIYLFMAVGSGW
jgi:hypothetical protein